MPKILNSANVAALMNILYKNTVGTTETTDGATADGLTVTEDLNNLVDVGVAVSNSLTMENFKNAVTGMLDGVGKIVYENIKENRSTKYGLAVEMSEFLTCIEKVRITGVDFEQSYMYATSGGSSFADMFNNHPLQFTVKVWNTIDTFRTKPYTISLEQLQSSVRNDTEFSRLIGEITALVYSTYNIALRAAEQRVVNQQIANAIMYRDGVNCIDLLKVFYDDTEKPLTYHSCKTSDEFKRWVYGYFNHIRLLLAEPSGNYNAVKNVINTTGEDYGGFILEPFKTAIMTISAHESGENFKNAFDGLVEVPFIQNINEPQKVDVVPVEPPVLTSGKHVTNVTCDNIVAMIFDKRGLMVSPTKIKTGAQRNEFDDWTNYVHNFKLRSLVDNGSNAIVFVIRDYTGETKAYTITEESDET